MTIGQAFDSILESVAIDIGTFRWETRTAFIVQVTGRLGPRVVRGRVDPGPLTAEALRDALSNALRDYCAIGAVEAAVGAATNP